MPDQSFELIHKLAGLRKNDAADFAYSPARVTGLNPPPQREDALAGDERDKVVDVGRVVVADPGNRVTCVRFGMDRSRAGEAGTERARSMNPHSVWHRGRAGESGDRTRQPPQRLHAGGR